MGMSSIAIYRETHPDEITALGVPGGLLGLSGSSSICFVSGFAGGPGGVGSGFVSGSGIENDPMLEGDSMDISAVSRVRTDIEISAGSRFSTDIEISACAIPIVTEKESDSAVVNRRPKESPLLVAARRAATGDDTYCVVEVRLRMKSAAVAEAGQRMARAMEKAEVLMVVMSDEQ